MNLFERIRLGLARRRDASSYPEPSIPDAPSPGRVQITETARTQNVMPPADSVFRPSRTLPDNWPRKVLFICSGNICRSAYAPVVFNRLLAKKNMSCRIFSAGTLRISGREAAPNMIRAAQELGDDLTHHRSTPLSAPLLQASDVIFVMSPEHVKVCCEFQPDCAPRICVLAHWLEPAAIEIPDPMGSPYEAYQRAVAQINQALEHWLDAWDEKS